MAILGWIKKDGLGFPIWSSFRTTVPPVEEAAQWTLIERPECECTTTSSSSTSSSSSSSSTTSTTTTAPPLEFTFEFDNSIDEVNLKLNNVTVEDSASNLLWNNEVIDLTIGPFVHTRSEADSTPTYDFEMTSDPGSDATSFNILCSIDGAPEFVFNPETPLGPGDNYTYSSMPSGGATTNITYRVVFKIP